MGGELVCTFTGEYASEHQIIHLELPTTLEPLVIALECLTVPCVLESCLPSSLIDNVDIIMRGAGPTRLCCMPRHMGGGRPW
jgi:hypothetical protein